MLGCDRYNHYISLFFVSLIFGNEMSSKQLKLLLLLATLVTLSRCKVSDQEEESTTYDSEPKSRMMEILDTAKSKMARNFQTIDLDKYYNGLFHPNSVAT